MDPNVTWIPSTRRCARVAVSRAARDVADYARSLVPTVGDEHVTPSEHILAARRLRLLALEVLDSAVLLAFTEGASWAEVAEACGLGEDAVRARYQGRWGSRTAPTEDGGEGVDVRMVARQLDVWCRDQLGDDLLTSDLSRPVSGNLY